MNNDMPHAVTHRQSGRLVAEIGAGIVWNHDRCTDADAGRGGALELIAVIGLATTAFLDVKVPDNCWFWM